MVTLELCLVDGVIILNIYLKYMIHFHRVMLDQYIVANWNTGLRFKKNPMFKRTKCFSLKEQDNLLFIYYDSLLNV